MTAGRCNADRLELAAANVRDQAGHIAEEAADLAAHHVGDRRSRSFVGHMQKAGAAGIDELLDTGAEPAPSTPGELAALLWLDTKKWARLIRDKKIKAE